MTKLLTTIFLVSATVALILWDVYVATNPVKGDTISEITLAFAMRHWSLALSVGVVCGHLFWPVVKVEDKWAKLISLWVIGGLSYTLDALGLVPDLLPIYPFILGVVLGHLLWPQSKKTKELL